MYHTLSPARSLSLPLTILSLVAIATLACGGTTSTAQDEGGFKLGFERGEVGGEIQDPTKSTPPKKTDTAKQESSKPANGSPQGSAANTLGKLPAPSKQAIASARTAQLPAVGKGETQAGPFDGPQGSIFYVNAQGQVSFYLPDYHAAYFASASPFKWTYGISTGGYFAFDAQNKAVELAEPPQQLLSWPMALPIAEQIAAFAEQLASGNSTLAQRDIETLSPSEKERFWKEMATTSELMDSSTMGVMRQIGASGCSEHYEGLYYLGCY